MQQITLAGQYHVKCEQVFALCFRCMV